MNDALANSPLLPEVGILTVVQRHWSEPGHYSQYQISSRLPRWFHVAWLEPPSEWREAWRPGRLFARQPQAPTPPGLEVVKSDPLLPVFYRPRWLAEWTADARLARADASLRRRGAATRVLYLWRPEFADALDRVPHDVSCYHIDDEYSFTAVETEVDRQERALLERVDQTFIHSPELLEKKSAFCRHVRHIPNGVDFAAYAEARPEPADLAAIPHPRIGYVGWLKRQVDWPLVLELAKRHPEWSFVLVGGRSPHAEIAATLDALAALPNAHLLGARHPDELPAYTQHFDACVMPYVQDAYTRYIHPLKLNEYLATGRPVVGTRLPGVADATDVVELAETATEWEAALARALAPAAMAPASVAARVAHARRYDWNTLAWQVADAVAERVGPDVHERFRAAGGPP